MQTSAVDGVLRVVPEPGSAELSLTKDEAAAILEIAFLAIAADRKLRDEELLAFRGVAGRLRDLSSDKAGAAPHEVGDRELDQILEGFSEDMDRNVAEERLRALGAQIARPEIKALAYKVAYALALCDLDTSDEEFEFDLQLVDALGLPQDQVEELEDAVMQAFQE